MRVSIQLTCEGAAFEDDAGAEVARILREVAAHFEGGWGDMPGTRPAFDVNGNSVGRVSVRGGKEGRR